MSASTNGRRWTTEYPELGTDPLPIEPYVSPQYFALEREKIFQRTWLCTGRRVEEIPQAGDYFVQDVRVGNASVLIVRGKDGVIRGFHNVCKHRGNRVVWDTQGSCSAGLTCKFHGWTYTAEGKLVGVPEEDMFFDFKKSEHGLTPVATDTWEGFIFVNLNPHPKETLHEYLGEVVDLLRGYPFNELPVCWSYTAEQKCNWRLLRDSQLESYHVKFLHRRALAGMMANKENPSVHVLDVKLFRHHSMMSFYGDRRNYKPTPLEVLATQYGTTLGKVVDVSDISQWPVGLNPTRSAHWSFDLYYIFPNFHLVILSPRLFVAHTMWPVTVDQSVWNARGYRPRAGSAAEWVSREYSKCFTRDVWLEDGSTLENTQLGITSGGITHYPLQDQEVLIRHAHKVAQDWIGG